MTATKPRFLSRPNFLIAGIRVVLPASMGFTFSSQSATCSESNTAISISSFINRTPICNLFYDTAAATKNDVWIQITNLATSTQPFYYGVKVAGLTNGPAATTVQLGSATCTSYTGIGFSTNRETAIIPSFAFTPISLDNGVTI